jgi:hypothetical protein
MPDACAIHTTSAPCAGGNHPAPASSHMHAAPRGDGSELDGPVSSVDRRPAASVEDARCRRGNERRQTCPSGLRSSFRGGLATAVPAVRGDQAHSHSPRATPSAVRVRAPHQSHGARRRHASHVAAPVSRKKREQKWEQRKRRQQQASRRCYAAALVQHNSLAGLPGRTR